MIQSPRIGMKLIFYEIYDDCNNNIRNNENNLNKK